MLSNNQMLSQIKIFIINNVNLLPFKSLNFKEIKYQQ